MRRRSVRRRAAAQQAVLALIKPDAATGSRLSIRRDDRLGVGFRQGNRLRQPGIRGGLHAPYCSFIRRQRRLRPTARQVVPAGEPVSLGRSDQRSRSPGAARPTRNLVGAAATRRGRGGNGLPGEALAECCPPIATCGRGIATLTVPLSAERRGWSASMRVDRERGWKAPATSWSTALLAWPLPIRGLNLNR